MALRKPQREQLLFIVDTFEELTAYSVGSLYEDPADGSVYRITRWQISYESEGRRILGVLGKLRPGALK